MDDPESWRWIWLAVAVVGLAGEIVTAGTFFLLPFGIGAGVAAISAFAGAEIWLQWLLFVAVSAVLTAAFRPIARRLDRTVSTEGIGARRWIGEVVLVLEDIPAGHDETGLVRVGREEWRAQTRAEIAVPPGARARVVDVTGTRLVVEPTTEGVPS
jgi:membrane protein implicated in regulation of membrane protease activity